MFVTKTPQAQNALVGLLQESSAFLCGFMVFAMGNQKILLLFVNKLVIVFVSHNPLVQGSSPCGPIKIKLRP